MKVCIVEATILWESAKIKRQDIEGVTHKIHGQQPALFEKSQKAEGMKNIEN